MQLTDKERGWLQQTDDLLYSIMESTSDVIAAVDTDFCYVAFNEAYREEIRCIYGVDIHIGTSIVEAFAHFPEDQKKIIRHTQRALRGESALVTEAYGDPGRSRKYYELRANPIRDANGTIIGAAQIGRDITERKQAEKALRLAKFTISNTSAEVFWIESNGHIFDANKSACAALGYTPEELSRMYVWNLDPNYSKEAWPSHWRELKERRAFTFESTQRAKDGRTFPTEVTVNFIEFEGKEYNCSIVMDITERKRAEEALQESEERYRELVNMSPDAIIVHKGGVVQYANLAALQLHGATSTDQLRGRNIFDFIHPDDHEMITERIRQIERGKETRFEEIRIIRLDGRLVDVESSARLIHYGGELAFQVIIRNITDRKRAEETLRESEEKFRALAESTKAGIILARGDKFIYVNPQTIKELGYTHDDLLAMNFWDVIHPDSRELVRRRGLGRLQGLSAPSTYEIKVTTKNGETLWMELTSTVIDYMGKPAILATIYNITERKRAEEALIKDRHILTKSQEVARVGNWAWNLETGKLTGSAENDRIFGYQPGEIESTIGWLLSRVLPEDHAMLSGFIEARARDGNRGSIDYRIRRPDGSVGYVNTIIDKSVRDRSGRIKRLYGISQDVTERKQAEITRSETERKLRGLIERSPDGITMVNEEGTIVVWNEGIERISGLKASEVLGKYIWEVQPVLGLDQGSTHEQHKAVKAFTTDMLQTGTSPLFNRFNEREIRRPDGSRRTIQSLIFPVQTSKGNMLGSITRDITERKQAEEEIKAAKEQAELYLDLMGHDISNMHQIILGNLELAQGILEGDGRGESMEKEMVDISLTTLQRSVKLIENIRNIQKLRLGEYRLEKKDLGDVLDQTVKGYAHLQGRDISIRYEPVQNCYVPATALVKDIFNNLIENAVKHCADPVRIDVSISPANIDGSHYYQVVVEDNGHGIPDDRKSSLFSRFKQDGTKKMGTGLGLYIVKTLVEGHNGKVWVEDRVKGDHAKGARFVVMLPAIEK